MLESIYENGLVLLAFWVVTSLIMLFIWGLLAWAVVSILSLRASHGGGHRPTSDVLWDAPAATVPDVSREGRGKRIAIETPSENSGRVDPDELAREARAWRLRVGQDVGSSSDA
jgi:hypothetical protein